MRVIKPAGPPPEQPAEDDYLEAFHPCDKCGIRSFEVWRHPRTWHVFTFCAHHGREQQIALHDLGYRLFMTAKANEGALWSACDGPPTISSTSPPPTPTPRCHGSQTRRQT